MRILVIDIGGSSVKFMIWGSRQRGKFASGPQLTAERFVSEICSATRGWLFDAISIGFPGLVIHGRPAADPGNLAKGWVAFDFPSHFKKPVKVMNDAAMQALGSYRGGRMLFLGLGTGIGSALILDEVIVPLELGELAFTKQKTLGDALGKKAARKTGWAVLEKRIHQIVPRLVKAFNADYVVLGGGSTAHLKRLPRGVRRGSNDNAFAGGARLWGRGRRKAEPREHTWVIV